MSALHRPKSVARWTDPFLILIVALGAYIAFRTAPIPDWQFALIIATGVFLVMSAIELMYAPWRGTPVPFVPIRTVLRNAAIKWLGLFPGILLVLFVWWLLPLYHYPEYNPSLFLASSVVIPVVLPCAALVIFFTEWRLGPVEDSHRHFGLLMLGRWREIHWNLIRDGLFAWFIRWFFLPLNYCSFVMAIATFRGKEMELLSSGLPHAEYVLEKMGYAAIIAAILPGYVFSSRLLGTQMKKIDQSWFGWTVTLLRYAPLCYGMHYWYDYYAYHAHPSWATPWTALLEDMPALSHIATGFLLFFAWVHYWGEAILGLRSSNMSNRGIVTNGPYRFCKHPVFLVKCLAWGVIWLPFAAGGSIAECIKLTLLWLCTCTHFFMRCWAEERLLQGDPVYAEYALWIDEHGIFSWLGKAIPFFSFRWRQAHWQRVLPASYKY